MSRLVVRDLLLLIVSVSMPIDLLEAQQFAPDAGVDSVFAEYDRFDVPGCAVGVYRNGQIQYARGYGLADLEHRVPITPATVFDIGSTSKQFTASTIVLLAQEGKLSLDDDVRRFLPELPVYDRPITILHLLHHTSGVRDYIGLLQLAGTRTDDVTTPDDALQMITRQQALNFAPGDEHLYSNSGYFLLSLIVERVTGRSLREEGRDRIFVPLGMSHTEYLGSYSDVIPNRAIGYEPAGSGFRADMPRWLQLGDGAVLTTVEDLQYWDENFRSMQIGGAAMQAALHTRGLLTNGDTLSYALGLMHGEHRGLRTVFHGGSWGGYVAEFLRFPEQRYGVSVLCNRSDANPPALALSVAEVHLVEEMDPLPSPEVAAAASASAPPSHQAPVVPARPLQQYAGSFLEAGSSNVVTLAVVDGALKVLEPGSFDLVSLGGDEFEVVGAPVRLYFEAGETADAPPSRLRVTVSGNENGSGDRITVQPMTSEHAAQFAGSYYSEELATSVVVSQADSGLSIEVPNSSPSPLRPVGKDHFLASGLALQFTRDTAGSVTGFVLNQGRARGMKFERTGN